MLFKSISILVTRSDSDIRSEDSELKARIRQLKHVEKPIQDKSPNISASSSPSSSNMSETIEKSSGSSPFTHLRPTPLPNKDIKTDSQVGVARVRQLATQKVKIIWI